MSISRSLSDSLKNVSVAPLDEAAAQEIAERARTGAVGISRLIQMAMREVKADV